MSIPAGEVSTAMNRAQNWSFKSDSLPHEPEIDADAKRPVERSVGRRREVTASQMIPDNKTGGSRVLIYGSPFYWSSHLQGWLRDYHARSGEYDLAPICADPENLDL